MPRRKGPKAWTGTGTEPVIWLAEEDAVDLGKARDWSVLFAGLEAALPGDCYLYLEASSMTPDVRAFVERQAVEPLAHVARGTIWPKPRVFHLLATRETLAELARLSDVHAAPEVCDHLVVYRDARVILAAHDYGFDHVYVSRSLPAEAIDRLRSCL